MSPSGQASRADGEGGEDRPFVAELARRCVAVCLCGVRQASVQSARSKDWSSFLLFRGGPGRRRNQEDAPGSLPSELRPRHGAAGPETRILAMRTISARVGSESHARAASDAYKIPFSIRGDDGQRPLSTGHGTSWKRIDQTAEVGATAIHGARRLRRLSDECAEPAVDANGWRRIRAVWNDVLKYVRENGNPPGDLWHRFPVRFLFPATTLDLVVPENIRKVRRGCRR